MERTREIQRIVEERGIEKLIHFTRMKHLNSILREGLLSREELEHRVATQYGYEAPDFNDQQRINGEKRATCLSISFPNYSMFYKYRRRPEGDGWVLLALKPRLLWELDCAFCSENAASNAARSIPMVERKTAMAFARMFEDSNNGGEKSIRAQENLSDKHPTHPQAEVLVFGRIAPEYIKTVGFYSNSDLQNWRTMQEHGVNVECRVAPAYYNKREYSLSRNLIQ